MHLEHGRGGAVSRTALAPAFLGVAAFLIVCGPAILSPTNIAWLDRNDPSTHYLGWVFFRADAWRFPVGLNPDYGLGIGNAIIYSDSNPILAIAFKALSPLLPETFQYFGFWILFCFIAQAYLAWHIVRLSTDNTIIALLGAAFLVFAPPMLWRLHAHLSLFGHFFILAALYLLLAQTVTHARIKWFVLLATVAATHAYLFVCVGAFWTVYVVRELASVERRTLPLHIIACVATCIIVAWQVGYLTVGNGVAGHGYGVFRSNLLTFVDSEGWSYLLPNVSNPIYDIEGFAFFGAGVLLLVPIALFAKARRRGATGLRIDALLLLACAGLAAFAVSHKVGLGETTYHIEMLDFIVPFGDVFRASGRFIWPGYYLLLALIICTLAARLPVRIATPVLAIALWIQVADGYSGWGHVRNGLNVPPASTWNSPLTAPFWQTAGRTYSKVVRFPIDNQPPNWQYIAQWAAQNEMSTNLVYLARIDRDKRLEEANRLQAQLQSGALEPGVLYLVNPEDDRVAAMMADLEQSAVVRQINGWTIVEPKAGPTTQ